MFNVKQEANSSLMNSCMRSREEQLMFTDVDFEVPEDLLLRASSEHRLQLLKASAPSEGMRKLAGWILEG